MGWLGKLLGSEQAIDHIGNVASKGMDIWDMSNFTPQERVAAFERLAKVTGSQETAISRRILLWALVIAINSCLSLGSIWVALGELDKVSNLIDLVHALKLDWAFVSAVSFYYLTHILNGKGKAK
jgi:hypothetical protein